MEEIVWSLQPSTNPAVLPNPETQPQASESLQDISPTSVIRNGIRIDFVAPKASKLSRQESENATFFVNTTPGVSQEKEFKRLVRSQAMKAYHARRRSKVAADVKMHARSMVSPPFSYPDTPQLEFGGGAVDHSILSYPFPDPATPDYLHYVPNDTPEDVIMYDQLQFPIGSPGGASFFQTMANTALWIQVVAGESEDLREYMYNQEMQHTTRALNLVRKMLLDPREQLSQGTISAVTHLLLYASMKGDDIAAAYHLDGLEKLIKLRGGFETLRNNVQAYVSWGDTLLACTWDLKPRFPAPKNYYLVTTEADASVNAGVLSICQTLQERFPALDVMTALFQETNRLSCFYQTTLHTHRTLTTSDANRLTSLWHRLLSLQQPIRANNPSTIISEILRLSSLITITAIWRFVNGIPADYYARTAQIPKLRRVMEEQRVDWVGLGLGNLKAWVVSVGLLHCFEEGDREFWWVVWRECLEEVSKKGEDGGAREEEGIELDLSVPEVLKDVIWVEELHGVRYRDLVERRGGVL